VCPTAFAALHGICYNQLSYLAKSLSNLETIIEEEEEEEEEEELNFNTTLSKKDRIFSFLKYLYKSDELSEPVPGGMP